ncbi:MAG: peptidylprolyl isomerase, partial [Planctomycetota bacterium]|nr:peptidylprolyl isomerase [Planctomycetota bacterium]
FFKSKDLIGWNSIVDRRAKNINIRDNGGSQGDRFLNIDSSPETIDGVFQELETEANTQYFISFDLKSASGIPDDQNDLRVRWNGEFMGKFSGDDQWETFGFFAEAETDLTRLVFREAGTGEGRGPFVDNLKIDKLLPGPGSLSVDITGNTPKTFIENSGPKSLFNNNLSSGNSVLQQLTGAVVKIGNLKNAGEEFLAVDDANSNINVDYHPSSGRLRLSGRHSLAEYEQLLNTLTYNNLSSNPDTTQRSVRISVDYGQSYSHFNSININIRPVNGRPEIEPISDQIVTALTPYEFAISASDEEGEPLSYTVQAVGNALGNGDLPPEISDSGLITWTPQQSGSLTIQVRATDPEGAYAEQEYTLDSVVDADLPQDFQPFAGDRQLANVVPDLRNSVYSSAPEFNIDLDNQYTAVFQTDDGEIYVELYDNETPQTVNSFVNLARDGYYDGLTFHRVISLIGSTNSGFIYQGGDPLGTGTGGPGYNIGDELLPELNFDKPVIAMANRGVGTFSNGSQFFLTQDDKVQHLNQNHTIFGEITSGFDVVEEIQKRSPGSSVPAEIIRKITIVESA